MTTDPKIKTNLTITKSNIDYCLASISLSGSAPTILAGFVG